MVDRNLSGEDAGRDQAHGLEAKVDRLTAVAERMVVSMNAMSAKVDGMDGRLGGVETKLSDLEARLTALEVKREAETKPYGKYRSPDLRETRERDAGYFLISEL
ncbi:hypothetical protein ACQ5SO_10620 [Rhodovulum sp. DZ06]